MERLDIGNHFNEMEITLIIDCNAEKEKFSPTCFHQSLKTLQINPNSDNVFTGGLGLWVPLWLKEIKCSVKFY